MLIYSAGQLYDEVADLYFPTFPPVYNGQVPGGMNSLSIQNASFWQLTYTDAVNGPIVIPPYCTVSFTVNPGISFTITPNFALVDLAVTGVLVLPYGWTPTGVGVTGNFSPVAAAPNVVNTFPYVESPTTVAGIFGPNQNDVEIQPRPPQVVVSSSVTMGAITKVVIIAAPPAGESIRLRVVSISGGTSGPANLIVSESATTILRADTTLGLAIPPFYFDYQGFVCTPGNGIDFTNNTGSSQSFNYTIAYDVY